MTEWLLIDGSSLIFRAFYGVPQTTRAPDGTLTNAARGFLDNLARLITDRRPHRVAVGTDEDWRPDWRVELIPSYKVHRTAEPIPPALIPQMPLIMACLRAVGVDAVGMTDFEAEDIIASIVARAKPPIEIVSGDRDLFALIRDPDILVLYPEKIGLSTITEGEVEKRYGIPGRSYPDFAILRGDPSDGLPGVAGIGAKKAADLIARHGSVRGMIEAGVFRATDVEYLERALKVVPPREDLEFDMPAGRRDAYPEDPEMVAAIGAQYGLANSMQRLITALSLPR